MSKSSVVLGVVLVAVAGQLRLDLASAAAAKCEHGGPDYPTCLLRLNPSNLRLKMLQSVGESKPSLDFQSLRSKINSPAFRKSYSDSQILNTMKSLESEDLITADPDVHKNKQGTIKLGPAFHD